MANEIPDPSFEAGVGDWTGHPPADVTVTQDTEGAHTGSASLGVTCTTAIASGGMQPQLLTLTPAAVPGQIWEASAWVWHNSGSDETFVPVLSRHVNGGWSNDNGSSTAVPTDTWTQISHRAVLPSGTDMVSARYLFFGFLGRAIALGEFYRVDDVSLEQKTVTTTLAGSASPGAEGWNVTFDATTDAIAGTDYDAWQMLQDGVQAASGTGALPATISGVTQPQNTTATYTLQLTFAPATGDPVIVSEATDTISTTAPAGKTLVVTGDGERSAWVEIQQWPQRPFSRVYSLIPIRNAAAPVVISQFSNWPRSVITLITRTEQERVDLVNTLQRPGPSRLIPACPTIPSPWFMPLEFTVIRVYNRPDSELFFTELTMQEITAPPAQGLKATTNVSGEEAR